MGRKKGVLYPDSIAFIVIVSKDTHIDNSIQSKLNPSLYSVDEYRLLRSYETLSNDIYKSMLESGLKGFISPLHYPEGDDVQYHFHVMIIRPARSGFSIDSWRYIASGLGALNGYVIALDAPHEYSRYLIHNGYSEKKQYLSENVLEVGLSYSVYSKQSDYKSILDEDTNKIFLDIIAFINIHSIDLFSSLVDYAVLEKPSWFPVIKSNRALILDYMRSKEYEYRRLIRQYDKENSL